MIGASSSKAPGSSSWSCSESTISISSSKSSFDISFNSSSTLTGLGGSTITEASSTSKADSDANVQLASVLDSCSGISDLSLGSVASTRSISRADSTTASTSGCSAVGMRESTSGGWLIILSSSCSLSTIGVSCSPVWLEAGSTALGLLSSIAPSPVELSIDTTIVGILLDSSLR